MSNKTPQQDNRAYRKALGQYATGVAVITTKHQGQYAGITANSFSSVSIDPPLVLWSLDKQSNSLQAFQNSGYYTVNVLPNDQIDVSNQFAKAEGDKFVNITIKEGEGGSPILKGCIASFQCKTVQQYEGGDHIIFIGEVISYDNNNKDGLLFHQGKYAISKTHPSLEK